MWNLSTIIYQTLFGGEGVLEPTAIDSNVNCQEMAKVFQGLFVRHCTSCCFSDDSLKIECSSLIAV